MTLFIAAIGFDPVALLSIGLGLLGVWFGGDLLLYIAGSIGHHVYGETIPPWLKVIGPTWKDVGIASKAVVTIALFSVWAAVVSGNWWMFPVAVIGLPVGFVILTRIMDAGPAAG